MAGAADNVSRPARGQHAGASTRAIGAQPPTSAFDGKISPESFTLIPSPWRASSTLTRGRDVRAMCSEYSQFDRAVATGVEPTFTPNQQMVQADEEGQGRNNTTSR